MRGNPIGDFNTRGLTKCPYCGGYIPDAVIDGHMGQCTSNPANQTEEA